jgi:hypothetical protein
MKKYTGVASIMLMIMLAIAAVLFIRLSNDHQECEEVIKHSQNANGNDVVTTEHVCKEKYNL